jgi:hypothetical protein
MANKFAIGRLGSGSVGLKFDWRALCKIGQFYLRPNFIANLAHFFIFICFLNPIWHA